MIPADSIVPTKKNSSFVLNNILFRAFDYFVPMFDEELEDKYIFVIQQWYGRIPYINSDISPETIKASFEEYKKCFRMKRHIVDQYMQLLGQENEPVDEILDILNITELMPRIYVKEYICSTYRTDN